MHPPVLHNEKELLLQIAKGDEAAFATLFYAYLGRLRPFLLKLTRSEADTEEVLQETFIRLWMSRDKLEEVQVPHAWIFTIASNECYKYLKKKISREQRQSVFGKDGAASGAGSGDDESTLHAVQLKEVRRLIAEAVSQLPLRRRRIYQMSRDEGMKIPDIADALRISPHTVKNALAKSLGFIRQYLAAQGHEL